jgi:uncharacterized membrane protein
MNLARLWHRLCLNCTLLLLLTVVTDQLVLKSNVVAATVFALPLLLLVYSLLTKKIRLLQWLGFVLMFYFLANVLAIFSPGRMYAGIIASVLCVLTFISAMLFIHTTKKTVITPVSKENAP